MLKNKSINLTDLYGSLHPSTVKYAFFSNAHGAFLRINHMLGHKTNFNKFKKIERIQSMFFYHSGMKLEIH